MGAGHEGLKPLDLETFMAEKDEVEQLRNYHASVELYQSLYLGLPKGFRRYLRELLQEVRDLGDAENDSGSLIFAVRLIGSEEHKRLLSNPEIRKAIVLALSSAHDQVSVAVEAAIDAIHDQAIEVLDDQRSLVERCYAEHPYLPLSLTISGPYSWDGLKSNPDYRSSDLILVNGGVLEKPIDLGDAVVVSNRGTIRADIKCGFFFGGHILKVDSAEICESLRKGSESGKMPV